METTNQTAERPTMKMDDGHVEVSIWRHIGKYGPHYSITTQRFYLDANQQWQRSSSLTFRSLAAAIMLLQQAHEWCRRDRAGIMAQEPRPNGEAEQDGAPQTPATPSAQRPDASMIAKAFASITDTMTAIKNEVASLRAQDKADERTAAAKQPETQRQAQAQPTAQKPPSPVGAAFTGQAQQAGDVGF